MDLFGRGFDSGKTFQIFYLAASKSRIPQVMHHIDRDNFNLHYVWQYFAVTKHADAKEGWAKNAICNFVICNKSFSGRSNFRAAAHFLGSPVLGQIKAGLLPNIVIYKKDDGRGR